MEMEMEMGPVAASYLTRMLTFLVSQEEHLS